METMITDLWIFVPFWPSYRNPQMNWIYGHVPVRSTQTVWFVVEISWYGGFHRWGIPNSWMVYFMENPVKNGWSGGTPFLRNRNIFLYTNYHQLISAADPRSAVLFNKNQIQKIHQTTSPWYQGKNMSDRLGWWENQIVRQPQKNEWRKKRFQFQFSSIFP